jgi:hypothetical protein
VGANAGERQARLRPAYAAWYPGLTVSAWVSARTTARAVARQLYEGEPRWSPRWQPGSRILDERHFVFRRGVDRSGDLRTRLGDRVEGQSQTTDQQFL